MIRAATPADTGVVSTLDAAVFGLDAWSAGTVAAELGGAGRHAVVAVRPGEALAGYAVTAVAGDVVDLARMAVASAHHRTGLATAMLTAVSSQGVRGGAVRMLLEVDPDNVAALAFYAAQGFAEVARRERYYRDGGDALVLERRLGVATERAR